MTRRITRKSSSRRATGTSAVAEIHDGTDIEVTLLARLQARMMGRSMIRRGPRNFSSNVKFYRVCSGVKSPRRLMGSNR